MAESIGKEDPVAARLWGVDAMRLLLGKMTKEVRKEKNILPADLEE